jgi:uncharacterized protein
VSNHINDIDTSAWVWFAVSEVIFLAFSALILINLLCGEENAMSDTVARQNVETVMTYYQKLQLSDGDGMAAFLADDLSYWVYSSSPYAGHYDRTTFLAVLPGFFAKQAKPIKFTFKAVTAQDDRVCVFAFGEMPLKDGGNYDNVFHFLFRLRDGKIVEITEVYAPQPSASTTSL